MPPETPADDTGSPRALPRSRLGVGCLAAGGLAWTLWLGWVADWLFAQSHPPSLIQTISLTWPLFAVGAAFVLVGVRVDGRRSSDGS